MKQSDGDRNDDKPAHLDVLEEDLQFKGDSPRYGTQKLQWWTS